MNFSKLLYNVLAVSVITLVIFISAYLFHSSQKNAKEDLYIKDNISHDNMQFISAKSTYELISENIFDNIINTEDIVSLMSKANSIDDPQVTSELREELYNRLLPLYENLKKQNISQLHFHLQGNISFLRFHKPEKFGDSLVGIRYSIDKVNRTKLSVHDFEEGGVFSGFRNVFPIMRNNRLVGTAGISYPIEAIIEQSKKVVPGHYSFFLKKDIIESKAFGNELIKYKPSSLSDNYLQDNESEYTRSDTVFNKELIEIINKNIIDEASKKLMQESEFLLKTKVDGIYYTITFLPIANSGGKHVAYYIIYKQDDTLWQIYNTYYVQLLLSFIMSLVISVLSVMYFRLQQKNTKTLEILATTDPLTKIANRNRLNMVMDASIQTSLRYDLPLSFIFFDIDDFKKINDKLGHDTGDEILTELSALVSSLIRSSDLLARWGGEEFIIVLPETNHIQARGLAEKLRKAVDEHTFVLTSKLTCSFGVTQLRKDDDENSMIKRVDAALYSAKEHGKNRVAEMI